MEDIELGSIVTANTNTLQHHVTYRTPNAASDATIFMNRLIIVTIYFVVTIIAIGLILSPLIYNWIQVHQQLWLNSNNGSSHQHLIKMD